MEDECSSSKKHGQGGRQVLRLEETLSIWKMSIWTQRDAMRVGDGHSGLKRWVGVGDKCWGSKGYSWDG